MTEAVRRTQVSKSHPAVKAILDAAFCSWGFSPKPGADWSGRTVVVIEANETWSHRVYFGDSTYACYVRLDHDGYAVSAQAFDSTRASVRNLLAAGYSPRSSSVTYMVGCRRDVDGTTYTLASGVLVLWSRFMGKDMGVEIVVPADGRLSFDQDAIAVAVDVVLADVMPGAKRSATTKAALMRCVYDVLVPSCGKMAGLASAVAFARAKLLSIKQSTVSRLADATSVAEVDSALTSLRRTSVAAYTQLVKERGGLVRIAEALCRKGRQP